MFWTDSGSIQTWVSPFPVSWCQLSSLVEQFEKWKKFGASREDPPGPQVSTTMPADDVKMQFIRNRAGEVSSSLPQQIDVSLRPVVLERLFERNPEL